MKGYTPTPSVPLNVFSFSSGTDTVVTLALVVVSMRILGLRFVFLN